ncbi:MAG: restriction endonuclease [Zoogloeaceae bacterium]|jgi:DNA modification methylase|nr:restriction endonuclease [Zoogloeaceae bacterium]
MSANKPTQPNANALYYGDNLDVLREYIKDESVDLIYLDPPFNSARDYNVLFASPKGEQSEAQIVAFKDTWHWGEQAERELFEIMHGQNTDAALMIEAFRQFLGKNDMLAYLVMMTNRLLELHRVLKPTGSLYLHCDPTASHYLRILLDCILGKENFRNEVYWHYYNKMHDYRKKLFPRATDTILFYTKCVGTDFSFQLLKELRDEPVRQLVRKKVDNKMVNARDEHGKLLYQVKEDRTLDNVWRIPMLQPASPERLGYPTQKPLALLERIVNASSNEGDVVLDPFCGCGTAVHAAQKLKRQWIGIDITHLAITLIEKRLKDAFPEIRFDVHGTPKDLEGARDLANRDKYQFQWWACSLVNAQPYQGKKKGADGGIDGLIFFQDDTDAHKKIIVSVKGGEKLDVRMIRELAQVVTREKAEIGLFVTLTQPTGPMVKEAVGEGYYTSPVTGKNFRKLQILTIAGLLNGNEKAEYPDFSYGATTFKKARVEAKTGKQGDMF